MLFTKSSVAMLAVGLTAILALPVAEARVPAPLSAERGHVDISSSSGSGAFGRWRVDPFGLPSYRYTLAELTDPRAPQAELAGSRDAWHQLGNDHIVANAYNHGYVQFWSQDRRYQWLNRYDAASGHYAGGYGYLRSGRQTISTLYDDRPKGSTSSRDFGVGYFHRSTAASGFAIDEYVYAPFGDDPLLLHDVTISNRSSRARKASWFEYWDVNPYDQATKSAISVGAPRYSGRTLSVAQNATATDAKPLSIFAAALRGPVRGYTASSAAFFGAGGRAAPAAVAADRLDRSLAGGGFVFRAPVTVPAHGSVTLRYAYGAAHASSIGKLVSRYRKRSAPLAASEASWRSWLPQITLGSGRSWLSRELQWDAYMLRSGATYEECRGAHVISQGGYYQYDFGFQGAFRDSLQHMLPIVYADPSLARDVLIYSAREQPHVGGQIPYAMSELCKPDDLGQSDDLDLWLLLAASEYGLGTRDLALFDRRLPFADGTSGSLWEHLKLAYRHQESLLGPHGGYLSGTAGDWSDFSTSYLQMSESMLVSAQLAYVYPRIAELADSRGDKSFAAELRGSGSRDLATTRVQWTGGGWYSRGYKADGTQIGSGAIFGEPQPWAILAGAPSASQAATLVGQIRRFLTGVGAPAQVHGPARIGSSQSPASNDPGVTEHSQPVTTGTGDNHAVFVGGSWYAVNGWLTWALGSLGGTVPHAREYAFDELERNTLAAHARAYPSHWNGTLSVDDACRSFYSTNPERCGIGLTTNYSGQIMHQPTWSLFDTIRLAGITPTAGGFRIEPQLPFGKFSLRVPNVGVAYSGRLARGYVVASSSDTLTMEVAPPGKGRYTAYANGRAVAAKKRDGLVVFSLRAKRGKPADWALAPA